MWVVIAQSKHPDGDVQVISIHEDFEDADAVRNANNGATSLSHFTVHEVN